MRIALIYNGEGNFTTGTYIEKVIKNTGIDYKHFQTQYSYDIPQEFDLYFRIDHGDYKYDLPENLRPAIFYVIDTHLKKPYKKIKRQVRHYDILFCAQKEGAERLRREEKVDTQWVPLACDPEIHKKLDIPKEYDIGFVGREGRKSARPSHLEFLRKKYPNSFIGTADFRKMAEIYSASKIGFNFSIRNDINMRIFEVMACGCFLLTNFIKDNGFSELFQNKKHLITYQSGREMLELIDYYLKHKDEREKIAKAGFEQVINHHTYHHRVQSMFNYIAFKFGGRFNKFRI